MLPGYLFIRLPGMLRTKGFGEVNPTPCLKA
jgi:hypothetical protein